MSKPQGFELRIIQQHLHDSALLYRVLAEQADEPDLRILFRGIERERADMARELAHEEVMDGEILPLSGTVGGIVDRIWLRVRDSVTHADSEVHLQECARAEEQLQQHYDKAIVDPHTSPHIRQLLKQQRAVLDENLVVLQRMSVGRS